MPLPKITPLTKKRVVYSDFKMDLKASPISSDLVVNKNEDAIQESIRNLILTDRGERLMQPNLGGDIRRRLFDLMNDPSMKLLEQYVRETINNHEPRVILNDVVVEPDDTNNRVAVTIMYYSINVQEVASFTVFLERIR